MEEITPLLPTGIGERYSQTISNLGHAPMWTPPINECVELTLVLDLSVLLRRFPCRTYVQCTIFKRGVGPGTLRSKYFARNITHLATSFLLPFSTSVYQYTYERKQADQRYYCILVAVQCLTNPWPAVPDSSWQRNTHAGLTQLTTGKNADAGVSSSRHSGTRHLQTYDFSTSQSKFNTTTSRVWTWKVYSCPPPAI